MIIPNPASGQAGRLAFLLTASIGAFLVLVYTFWIGFLGSDDTLYWAGAGGWLARFPYLGTTHWALRHTLVLPMAITRRVLGDGLPALLLPSLLYAIGAVVVAAIWTYRAAGPAASASAMALFVTCPQFILLASVANVDIVEVFFILLAFTFIHASMDPAVSPSRWRLWTLPVLAGIFAGLAMLSRETSAFAVVAIGLLFLAGQGMPRRRYVLIGAGFAAVVLAELLYVRWMSGDLFYRSSISLTHDDTIDRWMDQGAGVPLLHPLIDPITMLLFNHNFGLLTWIGVPLSVWLLRRGNNVPEPARRMAILALTLAVTWTVIAAGFWDQLQLIPRYFMLPALLVSLVSGIALTTLWRNGRRRLAESLGVLLLGANLLSMWIDNRNYLYGEHVLVDIASRKPGAIHTDMRTMRRAALLLSWNNTLGKVTWAPPAPGDLYFSNPARDDTPPGRNWTVIERHGLPPTLGQLLVKHLLPAGTLSPAIYARLGRGHPDVTLYRVP